ncbi:alkB, alkylation repair-like protein 7 [Oopsacas minuta]|uniref:AlkB, alkylation repair-like protein 7 n=1 Tax=Oopsacas minuta TaxID=111878 RepID=A0AAV7KD77_9METZ|nr:alkB, alkylation repair-like protein 7 [Oopsacas minuta]
MLKFKNLAKRNILYYFTNRIRYNSCNNLELCSSNFTDHKSLLIRDNFITTEEENAILKEVEKKLNRMKYESSHWDDVIHGYREIQKLHWLESTQFIIDRLRSLVPPPLLPHTHILDLSPEGYITPHIDSVEYCGPCFAVLSLLSDAVIRLEHTESPDHWFKVLIKRYSVYVLDGKLRYQYKHSILNGKDATVNEVKIEKGRRLSVIVRGDITKEP